MKNISVRNIIAKIIHSKEIRSTLSPFDNQSLIEIGGPSQIFTEEGYLPIYRMAKEVDNANFSSSTVWSKTNEDGIYKYEGGQGKNYILEASNLERLENESYDGLLASHCLEHCANPLKVLKEWSRVVRKGGHLLIILPDKNNTFDINRPYTSFQHVYEDYKNEVGEDDQTHIQEIVELHEVALDPGLQGDLRDRCLKNIENRCMHHHVFNEALISQMADHVHLKLILSYKLRPHHLIFLLVK